MRLGGITALVLHGLSDERFDQIDVDIPRTSSIRNKLIRAHRVSEEQIIGVVCQTFHDHCIKIYTRERSLCDAYRLDPDGSVFFKALKRYVKSGVVGSDGIARLDQVLNTQVLSSLTQELADE